MRKIKIVRTAKQRKVNNNRIGKVKGNLQQKEAKEVNQKQVRINLQGKVAERIVNLKQKLRKKVEEEGDQEIAVYRETAKVRIKGAAKVSIKEWAKVRIKETAM